ncbi:MAG TPA: phosphopantetheine-binding protein [Polyangium sp.]|jgi:acyl carrier protein|nr:phosphopantetheine-binding protein [Polyangium sp.]
MTWNRNTVENKIVEVFKQHRQSDVEVEMTTKIVSDLGIDSLGVMEVLSEIEDEYKLVVPDDVLKSLETVGDVIKAITERLAQDGKLSD